MCNPTTREVTAIRNVMTITFKLKFRVKPSSKAMDEENKTMTVVKKSIDSLSSIELPYNG